MTFTYICTISQGGNYDTPRTNDDIFFYRDLFLSEFDSETWKSMYSLA